MKLPIPIISFLLLCFVTDAEAGLPQYAVTRLSQWITFPLETGATDYTQFSVSVSPGPGGGNIGTQFADFNRLVGPPNLSTVTATEEYYITYKHTGAIIGFAAPPPGYQTGVGRATRFSTAGHVAFTVSDRRSDPDRLRGTEIARGNPDGSVDVLQGLRGAEQRGVNATGQVIAVGSDESSAFLYTNGGGWQNIGALPGTTFAVPIAINDRGTVVGVSSDSPGRNTPFIFRDRTGMSAITDGGRSIFGEAVAINNHGLVTGTANGRAFVFNGATMDLTWNTPDGTGLKAYDINDAGAIIGATRIGGSILGIPTDAAFYWDAENGLSGFQQLIGDQINDWFITDATDINDDGWILRTGFYRPDSTYHQLLLRPVPEPGAAVLLGLCGAGLLKQRRRKAPCA
jgi:hypothetical protein